RRTSMTALGASPGEAPKAVIEVRRAAGVATVVGGGVPVEHRGRGHGQRLGRQVMAELRAEGCRLVRTAEPPPGPGLRMLLQLGFRPAATGVLELEL
ncbi:MAG TPA: hypothetical protein VM367_12830, partial [Pseudonocardia sp.]|nr:hypothetical protein [Pseudonocardia sp.]